MTVINAIRYASAMEETKFSGKMLLRWINQIEAEIQTNLLLMPPTKIIQYTEADLEKHLIARAPFDKLYSEYLIWMIRTAQGETERANNQKQIFDDAYFAYARSLCRQKDKACKEKGKDPEQ